MFLCLLIAFLGAAITCDTASVLARTQVNQKLPQEQRIKWSRFSLAVGRKHREFFPDSSLASIIVWSFWATVVLFFAVLGDLIYHVLKIS